MYEIKIGGMKYGFFLCFYLVKTCFDFFEDRRTEVVVVFDISNCLDCFT